MKYAKPAPTPNIERDAENVHRFWILWKDTKLESKRTAFEEAETFFVKKHDCNWVNYIKEEERHR